MPKLTPVSFAKPWPFEIDAGDVVLVAAADGAAAAHIVSALADCGHAVVGPVDRAATALALADQAPVRRAVVYGRLAGRRIGRELAQLLAARYDVDTVLIDHDHAPVADAARRPA